MADERDELALREDESPEERDRRVLEERYGLKPRVRYMAAESVFDTSIDGGTDAQLARAYPTVAAAATKRGSDEEAAVLNAETPAARQEVYEQVQADKADAQEFPTKEQYDSQFSNRDEIKAELDKRSVVYDKTDTRDELLDALVANDEEAKSSEEKAAELHSEPVRDDSAEAKSSVELEDSKGHPYGDQPEGQKADIEAGFVARGDADKVEGADDSQEQVAPFELPENVSDPVAAQGDNTEEK